MKYARIQDGVVAEIIDHDDSVIPFGKMYTADVVAASIPAEEGVEEGWRVVQGEFLPPMTEDEKDEVDFSASPDSFRKKFLDQMDDEVGPDALASGFTYNGVRIQADPVAQQNANGFLTAASSGVPIPFPVEWRTKANTSYLISSMDELKMFSTKMLGFVQAVFKKRWEVKDQIRQASSAADVKAAFNSGKAFIEAIGDHV